MLGHSPRRRHCTLCSHSGTIVSIYSRTIYICAFGRHRLYVLTDGLPQYGRLRGGVAPHPQVIIFDWDDTLLPSTFLTHQQGLRCSDTFPLPEDILDSLQKLENMVICTLSEASRRGKVVIVTNAEDGWIEFSAQRFMPNLLPFLFQNAIRVISARSSFEDEFPDAPVEWKLQAFAQEVCSQWWWNADRTGSSLTLN